jgi:hypothetical protein
MKQAGLFGLSEHLKRLSAHGDPLEELGRIIDFEAFRPTLTAALAYGDGAKGGRPPYDPVAMLKVLVLAAQNNVADTQMEYLIRDRLILRQAQEAAVPWLRSWRADTRRQYDPARLWDDAPHHPPPVLPREADRGRCAGGGVCRLRPAAQAARLSRPTCEHARRLTGGSGQIVDDE